jgi:cytochrome c biogenesis factor
MLMFIDVVVVVDVVAVVIGTLYPLKKELPSGRHVRAGTVWYVHGT